jgi:hypothetical protein
MADVKWISRRFANGLIAVSFYGLFSAWTHGTRVLAGVWILATGFWTDGGVWVDSATWND